MKYKQEYFKTINKDKFVILVRERYPNIKESTAKRRYYDLKKKFGRQGGKFYPDEKYKPTRTKMLIYNDMIRFNKKITRKYLFKYGFNTMEINWLEDEGFI